MEYYLRINNIMDFEKFKYNLKKIQEDMIKIYVSNNCVSRDFRVVIVNNIIVEIKGHNYALKNEKSFYEGNDYKLTKYTGYEKKVFTLLSSL